MRQRGKPSLRFQVEQRAQERCEYCHAPQNACGYRFHLEHLIPRTLGGKDALPNRALACASPKESDGLFGVLRTCNLAKADKVTGVDSLTGEEVALFNPRTQVWEEHFRWADSQTIEGVTPIGRATVVALSMNSELRGQARELWFEKGLLP